MDHNLLLDSLLVGHRNVTQLVVANYEAPGLDWPVSAGHSKNSLRGLADVDGVFHSFLETMAFPEGLHGPSSFPLYVGGRVFIQASCAALKLTTPSYRVVGTLSQCISSRARNLFQALFPKSDIHETSSPQFVRYNAFHSAFGSSCCRQWHSRCTSWP